MRTLFLLMAGLISTQLAWADADAEIVYRQSVMKVVGGHMKSMGTILKDKVHKADLAYHANSMRDVALLVPQVFSLGSGEGKTQALAAIWEKPEAFKSALDSYVKASADMAEAVSSQDMNRVGPAMQALGKSCKGCHDDFKAKD